MDRQETTKENKSLSIIPFKSRIVFCFSNYFSEASCKKKTLHNFPQVSPSTHLLSGLAAQLDHSTECSYGAVICHSPSQFFSLSPVKSAIYSSKNTFICILESLGLRLMWLALIFSITEPQNICRISCECKSESSLVHPTQILLSFTLCWS